MRDIKFRAWFERDNAMAQVCVTINGCGFYDEVSKTVHEYVEGICSKPMQFTGLKDKNGVEIYEGDILELPLCKSPVSITWRNGCWCILSTNGGICSVYDDAPTAYNWEVIGNIYQNPELLEAE